MNVISYFLIVLGGFAMVWGFRWVKYGDKPKERLGEFEYAALSALWGSLLLFLIFAAMGITKWPGDDTINKLVAAPFMATPAIGAIGLFLGALGGYIRKGYRYLRKLP